MGYLLKSQDDRTIMAGLDSLEAFLISSQNIGELENVALRLEEVGILGLVDSLQSHHHELIFQKAGAVLEQCFNLPVRIYDYYSIGELSVRLTSRNHACALSSW